MSNEMRLFTVLLYFYRQLYMFRMILSSVGTSFDAFTSADGSNTVRPVPDVITVLSVLLMMDEGIIRNI